MAAIGTRPGLGSDVAVFIGSDDRTSWFYDFAPGVQFETLSQRALGETDMIHFQTGRSHTITATLRGITDAIDYFEAWAYGDLNDEREFKYRREGTGSGRPELELDLILSDFSANSDRDSEQAYTATFEVSQKPTLGTQ